MKRKLCDSFYVSIVLWLGTTSKQKVCTTVKLKYHETISAWYSIVAKRVIFECASICRIRWT